MEQLLLKLDSEKSQAEKSYGLLASGVALILLSLIFGIWVERVRIAPSAAASLLIFTVSAMASSTLSMPSSAPVKERESIPTIPLILPVTSLVSE